MKASGWLLVLIGTVIVSQVTVGNALERLGIVSS